MVIPFDLYLYGPRTSRATSEGQLREGHSDIIAMKSLVRLTVWWPKIDSDIESYVEKCISCQQHRSVEPSTPLYL